VEFNVVSLPLVEDHEADYKSIFQVSTRLIICHHHTVFLLYVFRKSSLKTRTEQIITMKSFISSMLLVLLLGVASAFFRPAVPFQVESTGFAMNNEPFGLDNPGELQIRHFWLTIVLRAGFGCQLSFYAILVFFIDVL
jgi:hypothetical protein